MNQLFSNSFPKFFAALKGLVGKAVLPIVLVGVLVLSTACNADASQVSMSKTSDAGYSNPYSGEGQHQKELYKPVQPAKGGMNNYSDDFRYDTSKDVQESTRNLINRVERNLQKRADDPQDLAENARRENPLGDKARNTAENLKDKTGNLVEDFSEGTQRGIRNLKQNADRAGDTAPRVIQEAQRNAEGAGRDAVEGAKDLAGGAQRAANRAANTVQDRVQNNM
ncbi:hypothetical protein [Pantanalinema sp. GBBB05]|uniref:hypothetical protein n=1 Tax=Pantanalinema sp. GBBB05 TaxID=2604139 RepID=UPI001D5DE7B1|nr:hypothetical protein [Pantanalinema sp. GBBB05]